ncbi:MAG: inner membrane CreD family protein [Kiritimatiellae bacterium]|nr:inner membrane CreD family protein [Kiritimatiellia bacterium]
MSIRRILAVGTIYVLACGGWWTLGTTTLLRSHGFSTRLDSEVQRLWGQPLVQEAPALAVEIPGSDRVKRLMPASNRIDVELSTDYRKKGLIWYPTYVCRFTGVYTLTNEEDVAQKVRLHFEFPCKQATYDAFSVSLDEQPLRVPVDTEAGIAEIVELAPGQSRVFRVAYHTRGIRDWRYRTDPHLGRVRNLTLVARTDFTNVDYTDGSLSPMQKEPIADGMRLTWTASDLITKQDIGIVVPEKLNPGPVSSRITFFAPVCLIFFFVLIGTINIVRKVNIHPMHYLFVAAGFFAFHLLLAYLVDHVDMHLAFLISAVTSVGLVTGYMSAALGKRFPRTAAVAGQLFFLVLFSYSFFFKGFTGLTVAIGSVVTLAVLMAVTARIDWNMVFGKGSRSGLQPPPLPTSSAAARDLP